MSCDSMISVDSLSVGVTDEIQTKRRILNNISLNIFSGELLALTGGSGSGKTTLLLALMGYLKEDTQRFSGSVTFENQTILSTQSNQQEIKDRHWGQSIALIPQNAGASLTPTMTVRNQLMESLRRNPNIHKKAVNAQIIRLLEKVNIPEPEQFQSKYPHELSGGQQQRFAIAIALGQQPKIAAA